MDLITSLKNPAVKRVASLMKSSKERRSEGLFPVEGPRMAREIPAGSLKELYMTEEFAEGSDGRELLAAVSVSGCDPLVVLVTEDVLVKMADTVHPQGVLALCSMTVVKEKAENEHPSLFLENIQDPGNVGTIIRTAEAAGISCIYLNEGCADIFSPKVVRSTMGTIFRVPITRCPDFRGEISAQKEQGRRFFAAALGGTRAYDEADYTKGPVAFLVGNEGKGLTEDTLALCDERILIPMEGSVESLNAAVAASLLMYEAARQRRAKAR